MSWSSMLFAFLISWFIDNPTMAFVAMIILAHIENAATRDRISRDLNG